MLKKEYDAYAFAYAVMKYRYENEFDPFIPLALVASVYDSQHFLLFALGQRFKPAVESS